MEEGSLFQRMKNIFQAEDEKLDDGMQKEAAVLIRNIFRYMDKDAKDIMTHRKNIVAIDGEELLEDALHFMLEESYSRFPIYHEDIDEITGFLHLREAITCYLDESLQNELGCSNQQDAINYIYSSLDSRIKTVNVFDTLKEHSDEYLYFRTDHHWTALGAYYTYCEYMNVKGDSPTLLSEYETLTFDNFLGTYYSSSNQNAALGANPDTIVAAVAQNTVWKIA